METYIRAQSKGYTFDEMMAHVSHDGGDGEGEQGGLCACTTISELTYNTVLGALDADDDVVVFEGSHICTIYDGERVQPIREVARFKVADLFSDEGIEAIGEFIA